MKSSKCLLSFLCMILLFSCCHTVFSQNSGSRLTIYITSRDSSIIYDAEAYIDGEKMKHDKGQLSYVKENFEFSEGRDYLIFIRHKFYQNRTIIVSSKGLIEHKGSGKEINYTSQKRIYLFDKSDHVFINGRDSVPFEYRPEYLRVTRYKKNMKDSALLLFRKLNLEIVEIDGSNFITLRKINGGRFKTGKCKELKAIRESGFVYDAGPLVNEGMFLNSIRIGCSETDKEKIIKIMKANGLMVKKIREKPYEITFIADNSMGYDITKISVSLLKYPEIKIIEVERKESNKIFE
jgi:hypothetical protein